MPKPPLRIAREGQEAAQTASGGHGCDVRYRVDRICSQCSHRRACSAHGLTA